MAISKGRVCRGCGSNGHDKRTCPTLLERSAVSQRNMVSQDLTGEVFISNDPIMFGVVPITVIITMRMLLENYAKTEEAKSEELIKADADSGAKVIVSGAAVGEMALHFL